MSQAPSGPSKAFDPAAFEAVLFDLNGTFMFGHDRLGEDEDFHATWRAHGGVGLEPAEVHRAVMAVIRDLARRYADPAEYDRFPSVTDTLRSLPETRHLVPAEIERLAEVIACHEVGDVDELHAAALRRIASSHPIGVVSNIWSQKQRWLDCLRERGLLDLFATIVFSSDGPHIKPSPVIFEKACNALDIAPGRILFVGDDPLYDIAGASAIGMRNVLVGSAETDAIEPDWRMADIPSLAERFG